MREAAPGGSTSMPHKRNPVAAIAALGCAQQAPGAGRAPCWPRWCRSTSAPPAPGTANGARCATCSITTGSAAAWLRTSLEGLEVDAERMLANLGDDRDTGAAVLLVDSALEHR